MRRRLVGFTMAAAVALSAGWATAQEGAGPAAANAAKPEQHAVPTWRSKATGNDLMQVYPEAARRHGVEGIALVRCSVTPQGEMADCAVEQEAPMGLGFGEAALKLMPRYRMTAQIAGGSPIAGGVVRLPIQFRLPR